MFDTKSFEAWKDDYDSGLLEQKDELEHILKDKYGKNFKVYGFISDNGALIEDKWGVLSPDDERFTVYGKNVNGYHYFDSYHKYLLYDEYKAKVDAILLREFPNAVYDLRMESHSPCRSGECDNFVLVCQLFVKAGKCTENELNIKSESVLRQLYSSNFKVWSEWRYNDGKDEYRTIKYINQNGTLNTQKQSNLRFVTVRPLDFIELEWLSTIIYLDEIVEYARLRNLGQIVKFMIDFVFPYKQFETGLPGELTKAQWLDILYNILQNPLLCSLKITRLIDVNQLNHLEYPDIFIGHRAVCFNDTHDNAYIIFRGTCGDLEWFDNGMGMLQSDTKQQLAALDFVEAVHSDDPTSLTVAGHSKGGNKAQYTFIVADEGMIDRCVSIDGQGFSNEFLKKYGQKIAERSSKIELIAEKRDFVNCLGNWIGETAYYDGWRARPQPTLPHGYPLHYFHCVDALYTEELKMLRYYGVGAVSDLINHFILYVLNEEKYADIKETTILSVISLMMIDRKATTKQIADAILNVAVIICDLLEHDEAFRQKVIRVFEEEEDMLMATFLFLRGENDSGISIEHEIPLIAHFFENVNIRFFRDRGFRRSLFATMQFFVGTITSLVTEETLKMIQTFFGQMATDLSKKSINYSTNRFLNTRMEQIKLSWDNWRNPSAVKAEAKPQRQLFDSLSFDELE